MNGTIAVVGGATVDIAGFPDGKLVLHDSNIGRVKTSFGGVGRNIAENCAKLGLSVEFVSALGNDEYGRGMLADLQRKNIGVTYTRLIPDCSTATYLYIADADGDMCCAVNDMAVIAQITPESLSPCIPSLNAVDAVCIDANLPEETIIYLAKTLTVPLFADAVSAAKVQRLRGVLPYLHCLKPNRIEAELLTGIAVTDAESAKTAAKKLVSLGVKNVFLTAGAYGTAYSSEKECGFLLPRKRDLISASGAGDAFTAALLRSFLHGASLRESCVAGMSAATIAIESESAVNPDMSEELLCRRIAELLDGLTF